MSNEIDIIRRLLRLQAARSGDSAAIEQALAELDRMEEALDLADGGDKGGMTIAERISELVPDTGAVTSNGQMAATAVLNDAEYTLLGHRIAREHHEYSSRMPDGEWALIAARKVVAMLREWGYIAPIPSHPIQG